MPKTCDTAAAPQASRKPPEDDGLSEIRACLMTPVQVSIYGAEILRALEANLPIGQDVASYTTIILGALNTGVMQAWALLAAPLNGQNHKLVGIIVSRIYASFDAGPRMLALHCLNGFEHISLGGWAKACNDIGTWARETAQCTSIVATTANPRVIEIMEFTGWDTTQVYAVKELT